MSDRIELADAMQWLECQQPGSARAIIQTRRTAAGSLPGPTKTARPRSGPLPSSSRPIAFCLLWMGNALEPRRMAFCGASESARWPGSWRVRQVT